MAIDVHEIEVSKLIPYVRNPRKNDHAVDKMVALLTEYGFKIPVLCKSSGELVDGHLRLKAALKMGLKTVSVSYVDDWSEAKLKAFRLIVNKSATWATWDEDLLKMEWDDLKGMNVELPALTGFEAIEFKQMGWEGLSASPVLGNWNESNLRSESPHQPEPSKQREMPPAAPLREDGAKIEYGDPRVHQAGSMDGEIRELDLKENAPVATEGESWQDKDHQAVGASAHCMSFGKWRVAMSDEEFQMLSDDFAIYVRDVGSNFGYVGSLVRRATQA